MKTTKTVFAILLSVLLLAMTVPFAFAEGGVDGNITWNYDESTKTLTISGNGPMTDHVSNRDNPWFHLSNYIEIVIINSGVTSIGANAFKNTSAETVTIPNTVTSIGEGAFSGCNNLKNITIPNSVTTIDDDAFYLCSSLHELTIPASVTSIGEEAFKYSSLYNLVLPERVTSLSFGESAFESTSIHELVIPEGVTSISAKCFYGCNGLVSITLPASVTSIGDKAFGYCESRLEHFYYKGTPEQWNNIVFGEDVFFYYNEAAGEYDNFDPTPLMQYPCHWCGGFHTEGFFQKIIAWFHNIFAAIFGAKY